jgi:hypothetical protein
VFRRHSTMQHKEFIPRWLRRAGLLVSMLVILAATPALPQALSGLDVYRANCGGCHELYDPAEPRRSRAEWEAILTRMVRERGASLDDREYVAVLNYLDGFNRTRREIAWSTAPAPARRVVFLPAEAGRLPTEWVDLTLGGDEPVPWAVQTDGAGAAAFLQPLRPAAEGQLPGLLDNSGTLAEGAVSTRLRIISGKGAVGAGILFGFRNPQQYWGVRVSPRDVVLYEARGGQRALRARAAVATPPREWLVLAVEIRGGQVRVSLNGKPLPELARSLDGYRGGHTGLHTQGDTVAHFERWELVPR